MKDNIPPEEKLLKLIKGEKKSLPPNLAQPDISKKPTHVASALKPQIKNSLYSFAHKYLIPIYTQKLVMVILLISFIYLITSFVYPWIGLKTIKLPDIPEEKLNLEEPKLELKEEPKPYEFYLQALSQRQIFSSPSTLGGASASGVVSADLIKDLNLVGIISGENPQAVIEDKKTHKTYYLNKGQFVGELQIEEIQEGKIIVNYNGQKYELYL